MPSAQTRIRTPNAAAYLTRLCGHLAKLASPRGFPGHGLQPHAGRQPPAVMHAEHTRDTGTITLTWGQLTLHASADELTIQADAGTPGQLTLKGEPTPRHANARFYVFNLSGHEGVIVTAAGDGSFVSSPFAAAAGDSVELYFDTVDGERSQETCTTVTVNAPLIGQTCF